MLTEGFLPTRWWDTLDSYDSNEQLPEWNVVFVFVRIWDLHLYFIYLFIIKYKNTKSETKSIGARTNV